MLVVEDDPPWRALLKELLTREGYEVLEAAEGFFAAQRAIIERPDLIVLDLGLPHIDGFRVLQELKSRQELAQLPILVLSARDDPETQQTVRELGGDVFISKMAELEEMLATIRSYLGGGASDPPPNRA